LGVKGGEPRGEVEVEDRWVNMSVSINSILGIIVILNIGLEAA
jgi:hypothetical protein